MRYSVNLTDFDYRRPCQLCGEKTDRSEIKHYGGFEYCGDCLKVCKSCSLALILDGEELHDYYECTSCDHLFCDGCSYMCRGCDDVYCESCMNFHLDYPLQDIVDAAYCENCEAEADREETRLQEERVD